MITQRNPNIIWLPRFGNNKVASMMPVVNNSTQNDHSGTDSAIPRRYQRQYALGSIVYITYSSCHNYKGRKRVKIQYIPSKPYLFVNHDNHFIVPR